MIDIKGEITLRHPIKAGGAEVGVLKYDYSRIKNIRSYVRKMDENIGQNLFVPSDQQKLYVFGESVTNEGIDRHDITERLTAADSFEVNAASDRFFAAVDEHVAGAVKYDESETEGAMRPACGVIRLETPLEMDGESVETVRFDFERLSAAALARAKDKAPKKTVGIFSYEQALNVFLEALKLGGTISAKEALQRLTILDFIAGINTAWVFCLSAVRMG